LGWPTLVAANPGDLDLSFGTGGKVTTVLGSFSGIVDLVIQNDGKLVAAGYTYVGADQEFALARYNTNGTLDGSFGSGGTVTTTFGSYMEGHGIVLQSDGKLVVAGTDYAPSPGPIVVMRFNTNGTLDGTFGSGGKATTVIGGTDSGAFPIVQQNDGKLVVAGGSGSNMALARYNPNGTLDGTFGSGGTVTTVGPQTAFALVLQNDGKLVAAGRSSDGLAFALVRYDADGTLDGTFGSGGIVTTSFGSYAGVLGLVLQSNGKLVAAGYASVGPTNEFALARYNPDGTLDGNFGSGGTVTTAIGSAAGANAVVTQSDGKLIAGGLAEVSGVLQFALVRYNSDGTLDGTFGSGGTVTTASGSQAYANALLLQDDDKLVAAGLAGGENFGFARYETNDVASGVVGANATITTDNEGDGATANDVVESSVTSPNPGSIDITERESQTSSPPGFALLGEEVQIMAPPASVGAPLSLVFRLDGAIIPSGQDETTIVVFKDGIAVPACTGAPSAVPDPCVANRTLVGDDAMLTVLTTTASDWTFATTECAAMPQVCRTPTVSGKAYLALTNKTPDDKDAFQWKWLTGAATTKAELGDPLHMDNYVVCLYDGAGLRAKLTASAGGICAGKDCWKDSPNGYKYKDKDATPSGITQLQIAEGVDGKAKIQIKGKGSYLPDLNLAALVSPIMVQLHAASGGVCFGAEYTFPSAISNDAVSFKDKAD